jgi:hypothetical protein
MDILSNNDKNVLDRDFDTGPERQWMKTQQLQEELGVKIIPCVEE